MSILTTVLVTSLVSILLTATALELSFEKDVDLNKELRAAGLASFVSGLAGGMVGFHSLSMPRLALSVGARSRWVGVAAGLLCGGVIWAGTGFVAYVPRFVCGGVLVFLGLIFLWEWVYEGRRQQRTCFAACGNSAALRVATRLRGRDDLRTFAPVPF
jgi:SulP family sulfate permease